MGYMLWKNTNVRKALGTIDSCEAALADFDKILKRAIEAVPADAFIPDRVHEGFIPEHLVIYLCQLHDAFIENAGIHSFHFRSRINLLKKLLSSTAFKAEIRKVCETLILASSISGGVDGVDSNEEMLLSKAPTSNFDADITEYSDTIERLVDSVGGSLLEEDLSFGDKINVLYDFEAHSLTELNRTGNRYNTTLLGLLRKMVDNRDKLSEDEQQMLDRLQVLFAKAPTVILRENSSTLLAKDTDELEKRLAHMYATVYHVCYPKAPKEDMLECIDLLLPFTSVFDEGRSDFEFDAGHCDIFAIPSVYSQPFRREQSSDLAASDATSQVIACLARMPMGASCLLGTSWTTLIRYQRLSLEHHKGNLPLFISQHAQDIKKLAPDRRFFLISDTDAVPIPNELPGIHNIVEAIRFGDFYSIVSWFLKSETLVMSSQRAFYSNVQKAMEDLLKAESKDVRLIWQVGLDAASHLPAALGENFLHKWVNESTAEVLSGLSPESVQIALMDYIKSLEFSKAQHVLFSLGQIVESSTNFKFIREWMSTKSSLEFSFENHFDHGVESEGQSRNNGTALPIADAFVSSIQQSSAKIDFQEGHVVAFDEMDPGACKQFVDHVLESRGVKVSFEEGFQNLAELFTQMNSSDVHFVMELVQNAADTTYDSSVLPRLKLNLYGDRLQIQSNEVGFSQANVASICSVGKSTKKHSAGFIGQKGIG